MTSQAVIGHTWLLLYRAIVGPNKRPASDRTPETEGGDLPALLRQLETRYGTQRAAADAFGIPVSTWGFWKAGKRRPKPDRMDALRAAQRRARVPAVREKWLRSDQSHIGLHLILTVSADSRERKIIITGWRESEGARGMRNRIMDAFFAMDGSAAVDEIESALNAGVDHDTDIDEIYDVRWFKTKAEAERWRR